MTDDVGFAGAWELPEHGEHRRRRLRWLARLRWWAAAGAMLGVLASIALEWKFLSTPAIVAGLVFMVAINGVLMWRTYAAVDIGRNELVLHAATDIVMLTWLLLWSGGVGNPLSSAYAFHVVLGALLNGRRGALWAAGMAFVAASSLWAVELLDVMPLPPLKTPPVLLSVMTLALLIVGFAYLALVTAVHTSREREKARLVEHRHMMLERHATLGRAMQGVAHELNTPLTTMQTLAKDLREALKDTELDPAVRKDVSESVELIVEEARRCRALTTALLSTANNSARGRGLSSALSEIARRAVKLVGASEIAVALDEASLKGAGEADPDRVVQVLMNLIQNALAATAELPSPRVWVSATVDGDVVKLRVRDRGPGLSEEVQRRVFEPFVTTKADGTGLGLYTSQRLAHDLGGTLALGPGDDGTGTEAVLTLPKR